MAKVLRDCIIHNSKCIEGSVVASARIAFFLQDLWGIPLIDTLTKAKEYEDTEFETLYYVNSPSAFCKPEFLHWVASKAMTCKKIIWIQNEITVYPPTQVRKILYTDHPLKFETWSNIPELPPHRVNIASWARFPMKCTQYVNWNKLTYCPVENPKPVLHPNMLLYYGAFREGRLDMFEKYLNTNPYYNVAVSAAPRAMEKFLDINPIAEDFGPFANLIAEIQQFPMAIYIEDELTNRFYNSPANRFYECLSAGVAQIFDASCVQNFNIAGYNISDYVVNDPSEVPDKLADYQSIASQQCADWRRDYKTELIEQVKELYDSEN